MSKDVFENVSESDAKYANFVLQNEDSEGWLKFAGKCLSSCTEFAPTPKCSRLKPQCNSISPFRKA